MILKCLITGVVTIIGILGRIITVLMESGEFVIDATV